MNLKTELYLCKILLHTYTLATHVNYYLLNTLPITTAMIFVHEFLLCHMLTMNYSYSYHTELFLETPPLNLSWESPPS